MPFSDSHRWLWIVLFGATAAACAEELSDFNSTLRAGRTETILQGEVRTVDVLFVVDGSKSMCEEQLRLRESIDTFAELPAETGADFRLAVINTDMRDTTGGQGVFRTGPGSTAQNGPGCSHPVVDAALCAGRTSETWLSSANYRGFQTAEDAAALQADLACRALTGLDGDEVEMGLETLRHALSRPEQQDFFRPGSLLVVLFVSDGNDCSDGTSPSGVGPVHALGADACEWNRNLEDSCTTEPDNDFCVWAGRDVIAAQHERLGVQCDADPVTGELCRNRLVPRREYYDFLTTLVAERNGYGNDEAGLLLAANDIIVGVVANRDAGRRYPSDVTPDRNWCSGSLEFDVAGEQGYRYELFARMFPEDHRVVFPICDNTDGRAVNFGPLLQLVGDVAGKAINSVCLQSKPMQCDPDGVDGDTCKPGARCCPSGQSCGPERLLQGVEGFEYSVCSGFEVVVEELTAVPDTFCATDGDCATSQRCADGECHTSKTLVQNVDFSVDLESQSCASTTGSPVEIGLETDPPARSRLVVSYPTVFLDVDSLWFVE